MSNTKTITVAELLEMQPGDKQNAVWINDDFEAVMTDLKPGQKVTTAILSDPHSPNIRIAATFFGRDCARFDRKLVHFSGKGMTRTEYKGTQQITIGDKATVQVLGAAPAGAAKNNPATGGASGGASGSSVIHGATVGMAINQATAAIAKAKGNEFTPAYLNSSAFAQDLHFTASDIIRVSRALEAGKLAPKAADRNDPDFKKKQEEAAAKAEADRKAAEEAERKRIEEEERAANRAPHGGGVDDIDQDIPFAPAMM
jgi:hypothetical protein